ncbi:MAG: serine/threonine transporter SstT [Aerococcus sp.]|nr:serine/threonine transporter SstT [Aerococcus sp.]
MKSLVTGWRRLSLIQQILIGMVLGIMLGLFVPRWSAIGILGELFIGALTAIAPLLVFVLIIAAVSRHKPGSKTHIQTVVGFYLVGTFFSAFSAVVAAYLFPVRLVLPNATDIGSAPTDLVQTLRGILLNAIMNPIQALTSGNYLAILVWAVLIGLALQRASDTTKGMLNDFSQAMTHVVQLVIHFVPLGIIGIVYQSVTAVGLSSMMQYLAIIAVVCGTLLFVYFIVYGLMVALSLRQNPWPLLWFCMKSSGVPAFFTRSSAASVPVNMQLSEELGLNRESYAISIPLGATANTGGAAVTVTLMTLAACHTLGVQVPFFMAFLLSLLAAISSMGASGIAGGSLLLIPLAASLFNIPTEVAAQVVGVGFVISVIQDSTETAVNVASDILFTATAEFYDSKKLGKPISLKERVKRAEREHVKN